MILDYLSLLLGEPQTDLQELIYYCVAAYLIIYLLKFVASAIFRIIGIKERRTFL